MEKFSEREPQVYVACLASYNAGRLVGKWFDLDDYETESDLHEAIQEYFKELDQSEPLEDGYEREEWAYHDFSDVDRAFQSEYSISDYFEFKAAIQEIENDYSIDAFEAFCTHFGYLDYSEAVDKFKDCYQGDYSDYNNPELEFTESYIEECGLLSQVPEDLRYYFDTEKYSDYLFTSGFTSADGYIFLNP